MQEEIWRDINSYEGLYQVSNLGNVKRVKAIITDVAQGSIRQREFSSRVLKQSVAGCGYLSVKLSKDGKVHRFNVHKLVAQAFIPNPDNLPEINHKDENKLNNCVDNLEWCTSMYNANYGNRNNLISRLKRERDRINRSKKFI